MSKKKNRVYVVTSGSYSSYRVVEACFTDPKKAKLFASGDPGDMQVEPFDLDVLPDYVSRGYKSWYVVFDQEGMIVENKNEAKPQGWVTGDFKQSTPDDFYDGLWGGKSMKMIRVVARTREEAVKIASDLRLAYRAREAQRIDDEMRETYGEI